MIKNLVFDFGQVMIRFDPLYMTKKYIDNDADARAAAGVIFDRLYWNPLDSGDIRDEEVVRLSKERLPEKFHKAVEDIYYNWIYNIPEIDGMREIVAFVKENGGLEYAERKLEEYVDKAVEALAVFPDSIEKEFLVQLAHFTAKREK